MRAGDLRRSQSTRCSPYEGQMRANSCSVTSSSHLLEAGERVATQPLRLRFRAPSPKLNEHILDYVKNARP